MKFWQHHTEILEVCSVGKWSAVIEKPVRQSFIVKLCHVGRDWLRSIHRSISVMCGIGNIVGLSYPAWGHSWTAWGHSWTACGHLGWGQLRRWSWSWVQLQLQLWSWSWNWSWNLQSWSWSWSWYSGNLPELELELKLPELELELELKLSGVGVGVEILSTFFYSCIIWNIWLWKLGPSHYA